MSAILEAEVPQAEIPEPTALYRIWGAADLLLYIGVSNDFGRRWKEHAKQQPWWGEMKRLTADEWFDSRGDAEDAEEAAIKAEHPKHNIIHNKPAVGARVARKPAEAARPAWIPVRIPSWENAPVHRFDQFLPRVRRGGYFTMTELVLSDAARAEAMIADLPGEMSEAARLKLEFWRMNYKICQAAWRQMQETYVLELNLDRPEVTAAARKVRAACRDTLELACPECGGKAPAGMTCQECDTPGPRRVLGRIVSAA